MQTSKRSRLDLSTVVEPSFFGALCDPTRLSLLAWLAQQKQPRSVSEVAEARAVDLSVVSRHLKQLRDAGIVEAARSGKEVLYKLNAAGVVGTLRALADAIESCCGKRAASRGTPSPSAQGRSS